MRLQKRFSRRYKDKKYFKYVIGIPVGVIERVGLKEGEELEIEMKDKDIIIRKKPVN